MIEIVLMFVLAIAFCSLQIYMMYIYFNGFLIKRVNGKVLIPVSFVLIGGTKLLPDTMSSIYKMGIFLLVLIIIIFTFFSGTIIQRSYHIIFFFVIMLLSELCLSFFVSYLPISEYGNSYFSNIFIYFIPNFLSLLLSLSIIKIVLFLKADVDVELETKEYCLLGITPLTSMIGIYWLSSYRNINLIYPYLFLLIVNACIMFVYYNLLKKNAELQKYLITETQNDYYQSCLYNQKELIQLKHDLKNILLDLDYYIKEGQLDKANSLLAKLIHTELYSYHNYSGCIPIDAILSSKIFILKQQQIKYTLDIQLPHDIQINEIEISAILGNLLDNAIEAVLRLDRDDKVINIRMKYTDKKLIIHIVNSSKTIKLDFSKQALVSEKAKGRLGIGISSIKDRVNKLGGYYDFSYADFQFQSIIVIPLLDTVS